MAPKRRSKNNGRRGLRRGKRGIIETFTFSVIQGNSAQVLSSALSSRPPRCNFRPIWFEVDVCGYSPGGTSTPGYLAPVGCQIGFRSEADSAYTSTSRLILAGATPKRLRTYYPRSSDWFPYNIASSTVIADINAVCVGPIGSTTVGYLRGIGRILFIFQEEQCATSCPAIGDVIDDINPVSSVVKPSTNHSVESELISTATQNNSGFELELVTICDQCKRVTINEQSFDI